MTAPTYTADQVAAAVKAALEGAAGQADAAMEEYAALAYDQSVVKVFTKDTTPRSENAAKCYGAGEIAAAIRGLAADPGAVARLVEAGRA